MLPDGPEALIPVFAETAVRRGRDLPGARRTLRRGLRPSWCSLFPDEPGEARVVLTERADRGGHHSGEVSFPGGRAEPEDADLVATALREAAEEVGLDPVAAGVRVHRDAADAVDPGVELHGDPGRGGGRTAARPRRPAAEVAAILEAPVAAFLPGGPLVWVERRIRGWDLRYAAYPVEGLGVWGMTARVLGGLGAWLGREDG